MSDLKKKKKTRKRERKARRGEKSTEMGFDRRCPTLFSIRLTTLAMQFHDLDLIRANYNARVNQILRACPLDLLISLIEEWFSIAPLKPTRLDATFDEYPTLKYKPAVLNRVHFDWVSPEKQSEIKSCCIHTA